MKRGELKGLRSIVHGLAALPIGEYRLAIQPQTGQAVPRPEGGFIILDLEGKLYLAIPQKEE